jgi:hypothetical protein
MREAKLFPVLPYRFLNHALGFQVQELEDDEKIISLREWKIKRISIVGK